MNKYLIKASTILLFAIGLVSCADLKHVSEFSTTSLEAVTAFETIPYNFEQSCLDGCRLENIKNLNILNDSCDCLGEQQADSISLKIYTSVYAYFDGLTKLSANDLTTYNTEALENTLSSGDFGPIKINQEESASYSRISTVVLGAFTNAYRKNKIREYIKEGNEPVKTLLSFLDFNLSSNLSGKLDVKKEQLKSDYFEFLQNTELSAQEKREIATDYFNGIETIENLQQKFALYSETLTEISEGHQTLTENADKLSVREIQEELFRYASDIKTIVIEFKKIRTNG
ncbi:hypothetical protein LV716_11155 [Flagellimonas sp. HMM57]|uniref:hypothetical protein n=1 Tax=unclassified Flagellimonas TaxID=2644544 RepID=UPI0013D5287B|nr:MULTISPECIES: hypothetical protein [unclassified Flagellimonas]UII74822.1 hypothetical protein LV716_11155 [Flagellimonas sp. HMM57]